MPTSERQERLEKKKKKGQKQKSCCDEFKKHKPKRLISMRDRHFLVFI